MARKPSTDDSVKRNDIWMPIFWGDYAKDTGHLGAAQHGAYLMLIKHYWVARCPLPNDDAQLWRIACCDSLSHWRKIKGVVLAFFQLRDGRLHHKRVDIELAKSKDRGVKASAAARLRWEEERRRQASEMDANAYADASIEHAPSICLGDAIHSHNKDSDSGKPPPGASPEEQPSPPVAAHGRLEGAAHDAVTRIAKARKMP